MKQIILNYLFVFGLPIAVGFAIRFLLRKSGKGFFVTVGLAALTLVGWAAAYVIPSHGSELYGILAIMATSAAAASVVTGLVLRLKARQ